MYLKLKDMCITRKFQLYLLRGAVHENSHIQERCAQLDWMQVVITLEHDLEAGLFVVEWAIGIFIEIADAAEFVWIKLDRDVLSPKAGLSLNRILLSLFNMTSSLELYPNFSWLIDGQV